MTNRLTVFAPFLVVLCCVALAQAQEVVRKQAPPEIKILIGDIVKAINGTADDFERFAQQRFTPELLQKHTAAERAALHGRLSSTFGQVGINGVRREGPDAPLLMMIKGAKSDGEISVEIDDGNPPKIVAFDSDAGKVVAAGAARPDETSSRTRDPLQPPVDASMTSVEIDQRLTAFFTRLAGEDTFSGVALVARNGVPVHFKAYGMANREKKIANDIRTRFNIGSINKTFTQVAIRQLVQAGKLSMTDTLGKFFPDYPQAVTRNATIEQLLTHRAGVADFFGPEFSNTPKSSFTSNADYFRFVSNRAPTFAPGERNQYCNGCYIALGAIVEKVSGMPYEKYVADNVFAKAEMTSTGYPRSDRPADDIAIGYTRRGGSSQDLKTSRPQDLKRSSPQDLKTSGPQDLRPNTAMHGVTGSAAGGGYSTALDLLTYVKAIKSGKFPGADQDLAIAGGAPGTNAIVESRGEWTVIVLTNFDPPTGERIGVGLAEALSK
jgi:D-alanyl-D-alanine carboxypeptidase